MEHEFAAVDTPFIVVNLYTQSVARFSDRWDAKKYAGTLVSLYQPFHPNVTVLSGGHREYWVGDYTGASEN